MLPNEEFALACRAYYEEQGLIVDATNGEFAHCPLPKGMGDKGYYLLWEHHQHQGLLQSRDVGRKCFWTPDVKKWLQESDYFPAGYFELWDIYEEFAKSPYLHTPEARKKAIETQKKKGIPAGSNLQRPEAIRNRLKPVEVTFPNGKVGVYPSLKFTALALGMPKGSVFNWIKRGRVNRWGSHRGYSARHV